jgi:hypothetical protein
MFSPREMMMSLRARLVPQESRRLQMPALRGVRGIAQDLHRQGAEIQAARDGEGSVRASREAKGGSRDMLHDGGRQIRVCRDEPFIVMMAQTRTTRRMAAHILRSSRRRFC